MISDEVFNLVFSLGTKTQPIENIIDYCTKEYASTSDKAGVITKAQNYAADSLVSRALHDYDVLSQNQSS